MSVHRYYFPLRNQLAGLNVPADVAPALGPQWDAASELVRVALVRAKGNTVNPTFINNPIPAGQPLGSRWAKLQGVSAPLPAGRMAGTMRAAFRVDQGNSNGRMAYTLTARIVSNDGATVRGVLVAAATSAEAPEPRQVRVLAPVALAPVDVIAGDRLVVEYGAYRGANATVARALNSEAGDPASVADLPYADGSLAAGVPWVEFDLLDPPGPPVNLRLLTATETRLDVDWDAPAAGPAPTGYQVRIDGGAVEDLGTEIDRPEAFLTLNDRTPGTTYLVEVRTVAGAQTSAWVGLQASTIAPAPVEGLRLEVGEEGAAIDLLGDAYSLTVRRGNATKGVTDTLDPSTLTAVIAGPQANPLLVPQVRTGAPVRLLVGLAGAWEPIYTGELDRVRLVYDDGADKASPDAYRTTLTATDPATPVLAATPHTTAIGGSFAQRVAHVLDPTGIAYAVTDAAGPGPTPDLPTGENTAAGNLAVVVDTAHGIAFVDRAGVLQVVSDNARPRTPDAAAADYLATDDPASSDDALHYYALTPSLDTDALVNVLEVDLDGTTSTHVDEASRGEWGPHADTVKVNDGVPETHADLWLASRRDPALRPEAVAFNVGHPRHPLRPAHLAAAATLEPYATVAVERAGTFEAPTKAIVRDITHTITASKRHGIKWLCILGLRAPEVLATRWDDVPAGIRWDDLPAGMSWDDAVKWWPYL